MFAGQSPVPECVVQTYDIDEPPKLMDMIRLPIELWFDILKGLSKDDWRAIAGVCRAFFDIVSSMTRIATYVVDDTCTEQMFQASTWLLGRAIQMHWSPISHPGWMGVPNLFSNGRAQRTDSFKTMIHFLSVCRNLTSLALTGIIVSGEHQHAIYSLPHLRKITLRSARFQNTAVKIPKHNVTHLRLFNVLSEVGLSHILHQTSSTLTTLQINEGPAKAFSLRTPRCPRLTTLTHSSPRSENKQVWSFLERNPTIRTIRLNARYCLPDQGPILLPTLSKMTASWEFGRFFLARPELIEFINTPVTTVGV